MSFGGDVEAKIIYDNLTSDLSFQVPVVDLDDPKFDFPGGSESDLYKPISRLKNEDLTTREIGGDGAFDALMQGMKEHLRIEFEKGRITGAEYSKAYIALTDSVMGNATQFLLGRDAAYWQAQLSQVQAITGRIQLQTAKVQLAQIQYEALTAQANYALTLMKLATEDATYGTAKYQLENLLPQQLTLLVEQSEAQRAQTKNTRLDGSPVEGTLGKQRDLLQQQITSYQRDSELKAAKMFADSWTVQKTVDEGLTAPTQFTNANIDQVLTAIRANNNLG